MSLRGLKGLGGLPGLSRGRGVVGGSAPVPQPPAGFVIITNDDGSYSVDPETGLIEIQEAA